MYSFSALTAKLIVGAICDLNVRVWHPALLFHHFFASNFKLRHTRTSGAEIRHTWALPTNLEPRNQDIKGHEFIGLRDLDKSTLASQLLAEPVGVFGTTVLKDPFARRQPTINNILRSDTSAGTGHVNGSTGVPRAFDQFLLSPNYKADSGPARQYLNVEGSSICLAFLCRKKNLFQHYIASLAASRLYYIALGTWPPKGFGPDCDRPRDIFPGGSGLSSKSGWCAIGNGFHIRRDGKAFKSRIIGDMEALPILLDTARRWNDSLQESLEISNFSLRTSSFCFRCVAPGAGEPFSRSELRLIHSYPVARSPSAENARQHNLVLKTGGAFRPVAERPPNGPPSPIPSYTSPGRATGCLGITSRWYPDPYDEGYHPATLHQRYGVAGLEPVMFMPTGQDRGPVILSAEGSYYYSYLGMNVQPKKNDAGLTVPHLFSLDLTTSSKEETFTKELRRASKLQVFEFRSVPAVNVDSRHQRASLRILVEYLEETDIHVAKPRLGAGAFLATRLFVKSSNGIE
ncbi:hypothetical protein DFH07DRAFT_772619 [Mycena maculata]|uniref:Uncharacterized protein n=1 Tax=Mycena maculata TaxID=230809 RepID=A0AAD7J733_9AGAR|nr:hypothetical protein DFH07DRAFT_772619 [Mycena maculata]